jgi:hypothetical protein
MKANNRAMIRIRAIPFCQVSKQGTRREGSPEMGGSIFLTVAVFAVRLLFSSSFHPAPNVYVLENSESHARAPLDFLEAIADGLVACSPPFLRVRPFCFGGSPGG